LAFLRAVDPTEADAFRTGVLQDFDGVAVKDGDDWAGEGGNGSGEVAPFLESGKRVNWSHREKHVL
jgi:hypothetical protein